MQLVKIKYSLENVLSLKLINSLSSIEFVEVLEILRYHRKRFFLLERITFKDSSIDFEKVIQEVFQPEVFQILERPKPNEILCIMKLRRIEGFWPKNVSGNWTIIPPIIFDEKYVKETLLIRDNFDETFRKYSEFLKDLEIIAINKIENINEYLSVSKMEDKDKSHSRAQHFFRNVQPYPRFSQRQQEIALYAVRNGYYESPKKLKAEALAKKFNISVSALNEHLRKAERTAMHYFFS